MIRRSLFAALAITTASLAGAASTQAGTYDVPACGAAGTNQSWTPSASPGMSASPAPTACGSGLVAENLQFGSTGALPTGTAARWRFDAPGGTAVTGISLDVEYLTKDAGWQAAFSNGERVLQGCGAGAACGSSSNFTFDIPPSPSIYTEAYCARGSCPATDLRARVTIRSAVVRVTDNGAPTVSSPGGRALTADWIGPNDSATFDTSDPSGITAVAAAIDDQTVGYQARACNQYRVRCEDWLGATLDVNARKFADGPHTLSITGVDRAGNRGGYTRKVNVDTTPPALPEGVGLVGGGTWRPINDTKLTWTNPPQTFAPIAGATYEICAARTSDCVTQSSDDPTSAAPSLPRPGLYDIRVWLRDAAGNATPQNAAAPIQVGWDADAPTEAVFAPLDPANPAQIRVVGTDATSGIAGGTIEYRRRGKKAWRGIRTSVADGAVVGVVPDGRLGDGRYQLRATIRDAAGNARSTDRRTNGRKAGVTLPLRVKARLLVGQARVATRRDRRGRRVRTTRYDSSPRIRVDTPARLRGRLVAPGGNPIAGAPITVSARPAVPGSAFVAVARLTTGPKGRFAYRSPPGASRIVRFSYAGAPQIRPQLRRVRIRVPARSTIEASRKRVVNGEPVRFTGRITTGPLPATGKLIELQFYDRGRWRTFRTTRANARGRWRYTYRFSGTVGRRVYRFRVHVPRESGYQYADGGSRSVRVTVQGL